MGECMFKVGDRVVLCMNSVPRSVQAVVSISGEKRISVRVTGDDHLFDERGNMRGKDSCHWYIRHGKPEELEALTIGGIRQQLRSTPWGNVPASKIRRIVEILMEEVSNG